MNALDVKQILYDMLIYLVLALFLPLVYADRLTGDQPTTETKFVYQGF